MNEVVVLLIAWEYVMGWLGGWCEGLVGGKRIVSSVSADMGVVVWVCEVKKLFSGISFVFLVGDIVGWRSVSSTTRPLITTRQ